MNSKIEEVNDPCLPNLLNMPKLVMEEVLKNLDCGSIFRLRKVSRDVRSSIDEIKPDLHLTSIRLELPLTTSSIESYLEHVKEFRKEDLMNLHRLRTGCRLDYKQGIFYKYAFISMEEAETLSKNTKLILDELDINLCFRIETRIEIIEKKEKDLKRFYESIKSLLKNRSCLLKTKKVKLEVHNLSEATDFLKCFDPKSLETVSIRAKNWNDPEEIEENCSELETLEKWKNAEELKILSPIESLASFKKITLWIDVISIEQLNALRELFVQSSEMEAFMIKSNKVRGMKEQLKINFGQFDSYEEEFETHLVTRERSLARSTWKWLKSIPGSTEKFQITLNVGYKNYITFSKVQLLFELFNNYGKIMKSLIEVLIRIKY